MRVLGQREAPQVAQHLQDVLVHRVDVEKVMLHLADDAAEHRQIAAQHRQLVHSSQFVQHALRLLQYREEGRAVARIATVACIDLHARMPQRAHQRRRHAAQFLVLCHQQERAQDAVRVAVQCVGCAQVEQFTACDECLVERLGRLVGTVQQPKFDVLQHLRIHLRDRLGRPVVALHQYFTGATRGGGAVAGMLGDGMLNVEHQPVFAPARDQVQPGADFLQPSLTAPNQPGLLGRDQAVARKLGPARAVAGGPRNPQQHVQVPQPARAFLDIGLEAVRRLVVLGVALALFENFRAKVGLAVERLDDGALEAPEERPWTGDEARLEQRSQHGHIRAGLVLTFPDRADTVADGEAEVPEAAHQSLDLRAFGVGGIVL